MAIELHHLHPSHDDELSRLKARIAELEEERRWRKFPDEKPNEKQWILVYYGYENYEKLEFELQEAKNDAWAANLVLADARCDLRKQLIKRCRQNQEYCYLRFLNEGRTRALFWLKWHNRWIELEKFYKESETEDW